jgi:uncharacterized membrane protein
MSPPDPPPLLDLRLTPQRSLSPAGFRALMIAVGMLSALWSLPFYLMGAWPVVGFVGLDVALIYWAFRANYAAARGYEELSVGYFEMLFARVGAKGLRREWRFNPAWVRLERYEDEDYGLLRLWLTARDRRWEIGGFLGPEQRADAARRLNDALVEARRGPRHGLL